MYKLKSIYFSFVVSIISVSILIYWQKPKKCKRNTGLLDVASRLTMLKQNTLVTIYQLK